jgi:hypothetical protein
MAFAAPTVTARAVMENVSAEKLKHLQQGCETDYFRLGLTVEFNTISKK